MKSLTKRKTKICLLTIGSVLLATVLVLSGIGIGFHFGKKYGKSKAEVNPLDFSIDAWDGKTVNANNFNENYAGRGSETYTIDSASSFVYFINQVNSGKSFEGVRVYLNKSIDLKGAKINSIGSIENPFKGTFDGGYYTIFNANINGNALFGYTKNSEIKNVGLYNATISSEGETVAGLVAKAVNTNISNTFVRLGSISGSSVAGLVGEFEVSNGVYSILNSFVDAELSGDVVSGLVHKFNIVESASMNSSDGFVEISNCYHTTSENVYAEINNATGLQISNVIKPKSKADFFNWNYAKDYLSGNEWCDYDYLEGSQKLNFNHPVQSGFVKVYLTGSHYESVVVTNNGTTLDTSNLAQAFVEADKAQEAEINLLVEKIFMESEAQVTNNVDVTVNTLKDTTIVRGEHNENSMFVSTGDSKITLGSNSKTRSTNTTLTLDGNRDYVEQNDLDSGALVVSYGGEVEIHNNVILQNNVNSTTGYGGAILVYGSESDNINISAEINNCSSKYAGGGICVVGGGDLSLCTITNCSAENGGGIAILDEIGDAEVIQTMKTLYGYGKSLNLTSTQYKSSTTFTSSESLPKISKCGAEKDGGAIYAYVLSSKKVDLVFDIADATPVFEDNYAMRYGGAIYVYGNLTINSGVEFVSNTAYCKGGAILCTDDAVIKDSRFNNNDAGGTSCCAEGGALWVRRCDISNTEFYNNDCVAPEEYAHGGAIYLSALSSEDFTSKFTNTTFTSNQAYSSWEGACGGAVYSKIQISIEDSTFSSNSTYFDGLRTGNKRSVGGAIYCEYVAEFSGKVKFEKNRATSQTGQGHGGALYYTKSSGDVSLTHITKDEESCLSFEGNHSTTYAGAIYVETNLTFSENGVFNFIGNYSENNGGAIWVGSSPTVTINGTTCFQGNRSYTAGGAIFSGSINILGTTQFIANQANTNGGAIFSSEVDIVGPTQFIDNQAVKNGGAIRSGGLVTIQNQCVFKSEELAEETVAQQGGAIYSDGYVNIYSTVEFYNLNTSNNGGAINCYYAYLNGNVQFENNKTTGSSGGSIYATYVDIDGDATFKNGIANANGGAIRCNDIVTINGTAKFETNSANNGGAIYTVELVSNENSDLKFLNNKSIKNGGAIVCKNGGIYSGATFDNNTAGEHGGAICVEGGLLITRDSASDSVIFNKNSATVNGGAIYIDNTEASGDLQLNANVSFTENSAKTYGGAIYSVKPLIMLSDMTYLFEKNSAGDGGSIYFWHNQGNLDLNGSITFAENTAYGAGGAVRSMMAITIQTAEVKFNKNVASYGGAVHANGDITISENANVSFLDNEAGGDGGSLYVHGTVLIEGETTFEGGIVGQNGGAIYSDSSSEDALVISASSNFKENKANCGGAIYVSSGTVNIDAETTNFENNTAKSSGGAIFAKNINLNSKTANFTSNTAGTNGGAIYVYNSTVNINSETANFISNTSEMYGGAIHGHIVNINSGTTNFTSNTAKDYGGAINASSVNINSETTNFISNTSETDGGAIHAYSTVNINSGTNVFTSNEARNGGAIYAPDVIISAGTTTFTTNSAKGGGGGAVRITRDFEALEGTTVDFMGNQAQTRGGAIRSSWVVHLYGKSTFEGNTATDYGGAVSCDLSITFGYNDTKFIENKSQNGGALHSGGLITLSGDVTFSKNEASLYGGAIDTTNDIDFSSSGTYIFSDNKSTNNGGAICCPEGNVSINGESSFINNDSIESSGGAIFASNLTIEGVSSFKDCDAAGNGGAIRMVVDLYMSESATFTNNTAGQYGGAIFGDQHMMFGGEQYQFTNNRSNENGGAIYCSTSLATGVIDENGGIVKFNGVMTFTNNSTNKSGGAVYCDNLEIANDVTFDQCKALNNHGGAIRCNNNLLVYASIATFTNNEAFAGGAVFVSANTEFRQNVTLIFENNSATYQGGALYIKDPVTLTSTANLTFKDNKVTGSSSASGGGAIYAAHQSSVINLSTGNILFDGNKCIGEDATSYGGAIYTNGSLVITSDASEYPIVFTNNSSSSGGAIDTNGELILTGTSENPIVFNNNSAKYQGGAIYKKSSYSTRLDWVNFQSNYCETDSAIDVCGGALYSTGSGAILLTNSTFTENYVKNEQISKNALGGAIYMNNSALNLTGCYFINNKVQFNSTSTDYIGAGGAIYSRAPIYAYTPESRLNEFVNNSVQSNQNNSNTYAGAIYGGALDFYEGDIKFYSNTASGYAGAQIYGAHINLKTNSIEFSGETANFALSKDAYIFVYCVLSDCEYSVFKEGIQAYSKSTDNLSGKIFYDLNEHAQEGVFNVVNLGDNFALNCYDILPKWGVIIEYLEKPTLTEEFVYFKNSELEIIPTGFDADKMDIIGNKATNVGNYAITVSLKEGYYWKDGSKNPINFTWSIVYPELTLCNEHGDNLTVYPKYLDTKLCKGVMNDEEAVLESPTREGYSFVGWADSNGQVVINSDGSLIANVENFTNENSQWIVAEDGLELYAKWEIIKYNIDVIVMLDGSDVDISSYGMSIDIALTYYDENGTSTGTENKTITAGTTLIIPHFTKYEITLNGYSDKLTSQFDYNGPSSGEILEEVDLTFTFTTAEYKALFVWDDDTHMKNKNDVKLNITCDSAYDFTDPDSYYDQSEFESKEFELNFGQTNTSNKVLFGDSQDCEIFIISNEAIGHGIDIYVGETLVASSDGNSCSFAWTAGSELCDISNRLITFNIIVKEIVQLRAVVDRTIADVTATNADLVDRTEGYVLFNTYYNTTSKLEATITDEHYDFVGWYSDSNYTDSALLSTDNPYEHTTLANETIYVKLAPKTYKIEVYWETAIVTHKPESITLTATDGSWSSTAIAHDEVVTLEVSYGTELTLTAIVEDSEYFYSISFSDGSLMSSQTTENRCELTWTVSGDNKFKLTIQESFSIRVYFDENNRASFELESEGDVTDAVEYINIWVSYGSYISLTTTDVAETYKFAGWYYDSEYQQLATENLQFVDESVESSYSLYQKIILAEYTVNFVVNSETPYGAVSPESVKVSHLTAIVERGNILTFGSSIEVVATPNASDEKYEYLFDGWTGVTETVIENITIIANFKKTAKTFSITYNLDGGELPDAIDENPTRYEYTCETETFKLNNPTMEGYEFAGWIGTGLDSLTQEVTIEKGSTGDREYTAKWYVNVTLESVNANSSTFAVSADDLNNNEVGSSSEKLQVLKGETYTFKISSLEYATTQILRIYFEDVLKKTTHSSEDVVDSPIFRTQINDHATIKFEFISAYLMTVNTPVNTIVGISVDEIDDGNNIVIKQSSGYIIANGSQVTFRVNSTPAETSEYIYTFIGFNYVVNGETKSAGVPGGSHFENTSFIDNPNYEESDIGTYLYSTKNGVQITEITVVAVVNKVINLNVSESTIGSGIITICSQYGFNKVIDKNTPNVVLYSGTWTVVSMTEDYEIAELESIFVGCEISESENGEITITIP